MIDSWLQQDREGIDYASVLALAFPGESCLKMMYDSSLPAMGCCTVLHLGSRTPLPRFSFEDTRGGTLIEWMAFEKDPMTPFHTAAFNSELDLLKEDDRIVLPSVKLSQLIATECGLPQPVQSVKPVHKGFGGKGAVKATSPKLDFAEASAQQRWVDDMLSASDALRLFYKGEDLSELRVVLPASIADCADLFEADLNMFMGASLLNDAVSLLNGKTCWPGLLQLNEEILNMDHTMMAALQFALLRITRRLIACGLRDAARRLVARVMDVRRTSKYFARQALVQRIIRFSPPGGALSLERGETAVVLLSIADSDATWDAHLAEVLTAADEGCARGVMLIANWPLPRRRQRGCGGGSRRTSNDPRCRGPLCAA